jgi:hypothetical protein
MRVLGEKAEGSGTSAPAKADEGAYEGGGGGEDEDTRVDVDVNGSGLAAAVCLVGGIVVDDGDIDPWRGYGVGVIGHGALFAVKRRVACV